MRIISETRLKDFVIAQPSAEKEVTLWIAVVRAAAWKNWQDVKATFGHRVDHVKVASGNAIGVFDIRNNDWRLIAAVHFVAKAPAKGRVYILRLLSHEEYDLDDWKEEL